MTEVLRQQGRIINGKRVLRIMRKLNILVTSYSRKSRKYNSYKGNVGIIAKHLLRRRFDTSIPHQKLTTDTTEFKYYEHGIVRKAYLNPYLDLFNREVLSFSFTKHPNADAVFGALEQAIEISSDCPFRRTIHSDQGWVYQLKAYSMKLKSHKIFQSMSRKGNCHDNSVMENFFGLLKQEIYYGHVFESFKSLGKAVSRWIEYYNTKRIKKKLNWLSPVNYRLQYEQNLL